MNAKQAAEFVNLIRPEEAIPVHYGSVALAGSPKDADTFIKYVDDTINVRLKLSF